MESRIEQLLNKYWEGNTTLAEEAEVKNYFNTNAGLGGMDDYFRQLNNIKSVDKNIEFVAPSKTLKKWYFMAASVLVIVCATIFLSLQEHSKKYLVEDPQEAFEITKKALLMVSDGLNEGTRYTAEIKQLNKAQEFIQE